LTYMFEVVHGPLVCDVRRAEALEVESPWSGRRYDAHHFVHAVIVWCSLNGFWARILACGAAEPLEVVVASTRKRLVESGFVGFKLQEALSLCQDAIEPVIFERLSSTVRHLNISSDWMPEGPRKPGGSEAAIGGHISRG